MATNSRPRSSILWRIVLAFVLLISALVVGAVGLATLLAPEIVVLLPERFQSQFGLTPETWWLLIAGTVLGVALLVWLMALWAIAPVRRLARVLAVKSPSVVRLPTRANDEIGVVARRYLAQLKAKAQLHQDLTALQADTKTQQEHMLALQQLLRTIHTADPARLPLSLAVPLAALLPQDRVIVAEVSNERLHYRFGSPRESELLLAPLDERTIGSLAVRQAQLVRCDDLQVELGLKATIAWDAVRTEIAVPVGVSERVVALLLLQSARPAAFDEAVLQEMRLVADTLGGAMERAALRQEERYRVQQLSTMARLSLQIPSITARERLPVRLFDLFHSALVADRCALLIPEQGMLNLVAGQGLPAAVIGRALTLEDLPLLKRSLGQHATVMINDTTRDLQYRPLPDCSAALRWLAAPITRAGRLPAALVIERVAGEAFTPADQASAELLASLIAIAWESGNYATDAQQRERQLEVLSSIAQLVSLAEPSRELRGLLRTVVHNTRQVVPCDYAVVALYQEEDDDFEVDVVYDYALRETDTLPAMRRTSGEHSSWQTIRRTGSPLVQQDLTRSAFAEDREMAARGFRSSVAVPVIGGERHFGALCLASRQLSGFLPSQISVLIEIARLVGTMLLQDDLERERESSVNELERSREHLALVDKVRLVGQLASGVAHDFNNLLGGILGNTQLLLMDITDQEQREMLKVIERAAKDGAETVRRLQGFARMQPDEQMMEVRLDRLAQDAIDLTRPRWRDVAQSRGARIEIERQLEELPAILGRAGELREVLSNLIINAADAIQRTGKIIVSSYLQDMADGPWVVVSITDTGSGIPPEVRSRIFDPFFTTKGERGTGLGLPVSLGIVQSHGGQLMVKSEVGAGSQFTIRLPVRAGSEAFVMPQPRRQLAMRPGHILFAASEVMLQVPTTRLLAYWGHRVTEVSSGAEALAAFAPNTFDMVLTDFALPDMHGWDLLAEIRRREISVATVLLSGWSTQEIEYPRVQADFILEKPFDQEDLRAVIAEALNLHPAPLAGAAD